MDSSTPTEERSSTRDRSISQIAQDTGLRFELEAMETIASALTNLDPQSRERVMEWIGSRFGLKQGADGIEPMGVGKESLSSPSKSFDQFVDLFDHANPTSDSERALVAGYWLQKIQAGETFTSQQANDLLREMGRGITNIAETLGRVQRRNPALVRQVSKSGKTKQARKTYKLTTSGCGEVERMLRQNSAGGD